MDNTSTNVLENVGAKAAQIAQGMQSIGQNIFGKSGELGENLIEKGSKIAAALQEQGQSLAAMGKQFAEKAKTDFAKDKAVLK